MFIISFSQLFLYDYSQGVIIIFLLSTSCPEVEKYQEIPKKNASCLQIIPQGIIPLGIIFRFNS